jgi:hypothetical protein
MTPPWLAPHDARLAVLAPLSVEARVARLDAWAREAGLRTESGRPLRFVPDAGTGEAQAGSQRPAYEARIFETGEVATRTDPAGARHDLCNALAWLAWPRAKARLNALHAAALAEGVGATAASGANPSVAPVAPLASVSVHTPVPRGPLRDAATLFDENAALWIGLDASLEAALRAFDWQSLFVRRRAQLCESVRLTVFGHALLEKLESPYKAVTAHAWPLRLSIDASIAEIDRALSLALDADSLSTRALCPLPVMGFPGWCAANADPHFYDDPAVFRSGRRGGKLPPDSRGGKLPPDSVAPGSSR